MVTGPPNHPITDNACGAAASAVDDVEWLRRLLKSRRSVRRYEQRPIEREVLEDLLTCATWAPSAHNRQPWRFCVVTSEDARENLAYRLGEVWASDLRADGVEEELIERRISLSTMRLTGAAALIVASLCMADMDVYPDGWRQNAERTMAVQSVALACQNLLLAAHGYGLGACWMCAPLFATDTVRLALALPETWEPQALVTVGYAAEERVSNREPLESCVVWRE